MLVKEGIKLRLAEEPSASIAEELKRVLFSFERCRGWDNLEFANITIDNMNCWWKRLGSGGWKLPSGRRAVPYKRSVVERYMLHLKKVARWLVQKNWIDVSCYHRLQLFSVPRAGAFGIRESEHRVPVDMDFAHGVLRHIRNDTFRDIMELIYISGMRPKEACDLHVTHLNTSRYDGVWTYWPHAHKNSHRNKNRVIFFGPRCQEILNRHLSKRRLEDGPVFRNDWGQPMKPRTMQTRIRYWCKKLDIPAWCQYQLRHNAGTDIAHEEGLLAAAAILGNTPEVARMHYCERDFKLAAEIARKRS